MKVHELKISPLHYMKINQGKKAYEIRKNDRDFRKGDILLLRCWNGKKYTGEEQLVQITGVIAGEDLKPLNLPTGIAIMDIQRLGARP